jgi:hypothetical protein
MRRWYARKEGLWQKNTAKADMAISCIEYWVFVPRRESGNDSMVVVRNDNKVLRVFPP